MKITTARKVSQAVFLLLFIWLSITIQLGTAFYEIRGWPVNLFLGADPLAAVSTALASGSLHAGLITGGIILIATVFLGRFFCGWICPFGAFHQIVSWLSWRGRKSSELLKANEYSRFQAVKYYVLLIFLGAAVTGLSSTLLTGLLDPIPLFHRSVNIAVMPIADYIGSGDFTRHYEFGLGIFAVFAAFTLLNIIRPRFFCKFVCPLGALLGIFSRFSLFRVAKVQDECRMCGLCNKTCHGSATPKTATKLSECMLCFNCREVCPDEVVGYMPAGSCKTESKPDISRRGVLLSFAAGGAGSYVVKAADKSSGSNWDSSIIRPPGSLKEEDFLQRCIKCGQCIRVCPSNVLQPAPIAKGLEVMWTPLLNNKIGTSGCQQNCTSCGAVCPTGAIKHLTLDEKHGTGEYADKGPVKLGTAFVDRSRCLPWAMNKPCIVCQENCPVSPKAIYTIDVYERVRNYSYHLESVEVSGGESSLQSASDISSAYATGDYYISAGEEKFRIKSIQGRTVTVEGEITNPNEVDKMEVLAHLQRPAVEIDRCIGCGICEHECPVSGKRAIRVTAEGESRDPESRLVLGS
ncbi:Putative electron transport protein YccM [Sedimentisphaera cyanobacteriorum]|uniref:Electron transport protein YccM n=1 Tax=Sedimentisphaera cyanobacteriorum TaxID=1940790 RepID=A0A1Q2HM71_9BACT|nr:4Fe-4S binding protein [Sedimentisphaera cyanobacteriorum]AQQ08567.1 Putative electron transport protein YccM [Sedimentisphaera cyanobacteriorum]